MRDKPFTAALRAEIDAVVARYEALATAHAEALDAARAQEVAALRAEITALKDELGRTRREAAEALARAEAAHKGELERERRALADARAAMEAELAQASARLRATEAEAQAARAATNALEEQFTAERRFIEACNAIAGSLLHEAIRGALGRETTPGPATYAALKGRGVEAVLTAALKERGRRVVEAPLLENERNALKAIAAAAGCELIVPAAGTRFSASSMDKASTAPEPAEEGNVLECLMPGSRLAGTEGALVFPRVLVATG